MKRHISRLMVAGLAVLVLALGATAVFAQAEDSAESATPDAHGPGRGAGFNRGGISAGDDYLADALGISAEALDAAQEEAQLAAVEKAVELGLITQEMADRMIESGRFGFGRAIAADEIDYDALLADALGISAEALDAARETAQQAAIDAALEEGIITQEQLDLRDAQQALKDVIDSKALMASVLGVSVEELEAALEAGTAQELVDATGLTTEELRAAMEQAYTDAVNQAVADGVITAEQAELVLENGFGVGGFGGGRGPGGRGHGGRGYGGPGGRGAPSEVAPDSDATTPSLETTSA